MIDRDAFRCLSLDALKGWDSMMGYQFETLVTNNIPALLPHLGLERALLLSAAPFRQLPTARKKGCQVDLLLQTEGAVCLVEIKRMREIVLKKSRTSFVRRSPGLRLSLAFPFARRWSTRVRYPLAWPPPPTSTSLLISDSCFLSRNQKFSVRSPRRDCRRS